MSLDQTSAPGSSGALVRKLGEQDFNIVNFGEHWRQCIAAAMAKGAVAVISRSASPGELASERTSTEASQESHPDSGL